MAHLLVTNDFPPKVGGIQTYLWELWRRLPAGETTVLTTAAPDAAAFDAAQPFRIERVDRQVMLPGRDLVRRVNRLAREAGAEIVVLDPALPAGLIGPRLDLPYALVLHGSELLGRLPGGSRLMGSVVAGARHVIAAGHFPASEARRVAGDRTPPVTVIPPGIDPRRFRPLGLAERAAARRRLGLPEDALLVVGLSRLVRRKGFDRLVEATARVAHRFPDLFLAIGGAGREHARLASLIRSTAAPARLIGRIADGDLSRFYGCADVFAMVCRTRWAGLEPEGFGIVFLEAAACGVPQVAGASGGAADAVVDGETGLVVADPDDVTATEEALVRLLGDPDARGAMGERSRARAVEHFSYDHLAARLALTLEGLR